MRVTKQDLERKIELLNHITGNPENPYTFNNHHVISNAGCYHLSGAYGGWELNQMCKSGGTRDVLNTGHIPKKELYNLICAFMEGIIRTKSNEL